MTDSQTTCTEAAVLGVPVVRSNSLVGTMSNFDELENDCGLVSSCRNPNRAISKAVELLETADLKTEWAQRRDRLVSEKVDTPTFMVDLVLKASRSSHGRAIA